MARMIPSAISPEIKSNAERKVFQMFENDSSTEGWTVLHSLGIANHRSKIHGELDFLVIAPKLGIFALEVKGGRVKREQGIWYFTDRYGQTNSKARGPFEQADDGIYSLFEMLRNKHGSNHRFARLLFGSGVMFPDIEFKSDDPGTDQWQIFDLRDNQDIGGFIRRLAKNTKRKWEEKFGQLPDDRVPDVRTARDLADVLRGDFDKAVSISIKIKYAEEELVSLTKEQMRCLDQIEDNSRCIIEGPAGTGKTLLAIEEVKRSASAGAKVAFFCYNNMLGNWLKNRFIDEVEELRPAYVGTFHAFLYQMAEKNDPCISNMQIDDEQEFFRERLPLMAMEAIESNDILFDKIVIDEVQDLLNPEYLDVLDMIVKNGLSRGKWSMFGDFTRQALYCDEGLIEKAKRMLEEKTSFIKFKLTINCRNTRTIGEEIRNITGFRSVAYLLADVDGPPVNYITYTDPADQKSKLESLLSDLFKANIDPSDITILSPTRREFSVVNIIDRVPIINFHPGIRNTVTFSTIQSFKGLENSVIIMTDMDRFTPDKLLYVGLSRARSALYILETIAADKEKTELMLRWIE